jgi:5-methylcytosine-specific restriction endonuclease McrA
LPNASALKGRPRRRLLAQVRAEEPDCWLCGKWIDQSLPHNHPRASTVDEIIPRSHGGSATDRANCRHAHRDCNTRRGNRPPQALERKTTRRW